MSNLPRKVDGETIHWVKIESAVLQTVITFCIHGQWMNRRQPLKGWLKNHEFTAESWNANDTQQKVEMQMIHNRKLKCKWYIHFWKFDMSFQKRNRYITSGHTRTI